MKILTEPSPKSELTRLVTGRGRLVRVELILPIVVGRMPPWLETLLEPYRVRFEQDSWCPDLWTALSRLSLTNSWLDRWGSVPGQEWFVSDPISRDEQPTVYDIAKRLRLDVAMSLNDSRHVFAPKGTWGRR